MSTLEFHRARIAELEAALQEARLQLEYFNEKGGAGNDPAVLLAKISMALAGCDTYEMETEPTLPRNALP